MKLRKLFAPLFAALVLTLAFAAIPSQAKAYCIVSGDVYKGNLPMAAVIEVRDGYNNLLGSEWTNGNGFYEVIIPDQSGIIVVQAAAKGHNVFERFTLASAITFADCPNGVVRQVYWEAVPR